MQLSEILQLADKQRIEFFPGDVLAAIWAIDSTASVDRRNPESVAAHNANVLAAHETLRAWVKAPSGVPNENKRNFVRSATLGEQFPSSVSAALSTVFLGEEGHTHPINPTVKGTGLKRQGKTPNYDKQGHVI